MGSAMQAKKRVAMFMPYAYLPISTSVINSAKTWESRGFGVDIFVPPVEYFGAPAFGAQDIVVHRVPGVHIPLLPGLAYPYAAVRAASRSHYACAVGFDQGGVIAAGALAAWTRCPYIYHSLEMALAEDVHGIRDKLMRAIETTCVRGATLVLAQDAERAALISGDRRVPAHRTMIAPNTPLGDFSGERSGYLRGKFGIPASTRIVLLSGSLIPEHLAREVIDSVGAWPEGFVLAVHGWAPVPEYKAEVLTAAARWPGRVFLSFDFLPMDRVDDLYSSADVGLAVYQPKDRNYEYIGAAAGKVFGFMRVGTPVIASDLPGLREIVVATGSGAVVQDVAGIPKRLLQINQSYEVHSRAAKSAFSRYEFSRHYARVIARLGGVGTTRRGDQSHVDERRA
jgi:glycosyltransferase involved in cell wall biosynthesis